MNIDSTELIYLVLGSGVFLLVAILLRVNLRLKQRYDDLASRLSDAEGRLGVIQAQQSDDSTSRELEERVERLSRQLEQLMLRDGDSGPYFRAVRIAEQGASIDSLIEKTGVTRAEAELILKLHAPQGAADKEQAK